MSSLPFFHQHTYQMQRRIRQSPQSLQGEWHERKDRRIRLRLDLGCVVRHVRRDHLALRRLRIRRP